MSEPVTKLPKRTRTGVLLETVAIVVLAILAAYGAAA